MTGDADDYTPGQIGSHKQCARKRCTVRISWRIILGHWQIQAYVCQGHVAWGLQLDLITESSGKAMGWRYGYPVFHDGIEICRSFGEARVIAEFGIVRRVDYTRDVASQISQHFPQPGNLAYEFNGETHNTRTKVWS
jgi:hypothetical protein